MDLAEENKELLKENKKLRRQIANFEDIVNRNNQMRTAHASLSKVILQEKSKQEMYMSLLMQNSPDIIVLFDNYRRVVNCTDSFLKRADIRNFGLINLRAFEVVFGAFLEAEHLKEVLDMFSRSEEEKCTINFDISLNIVNNSDERRDYAVTYTPMFDGEDALEGSILQLHDVTELLQAKQQAELASQAKSDFLATVSHEIRTPMNAIMGISDMMRQEELSPKISEYLDNIQISSRTLLSLINDILDFSKIEARKLELVPEYFRLDQMLEQLDVLFKNTYAKKDIIFVFETDPKLPQIVLGDEKRIRQILNNVLSNAFKYTDFGYVKLYAYRDAAGRFCFDVDDTGHGIREEDKSRIFRVFEQLDMVKNKKVVGTGLGLAITKRLCELMNGEITFTSTYGEGSCFTVRLPLEIGDESHLANVVGECIHFTAKDARILVVDDIEINVIVTKAALEIYDIHADAAGSGAEAIAKAKANVYDLIFMDHMMPEMDGVEATQQIRALGGYAAAVPIVALTANAVNSAEKFFLSNGFSGFLAKPIITEELNQCLRRFLSKEMIKLTEQK